MKYFNQFSLLLFIYYIGTILYKTIIPAIPPTVLGMIILFIFLTLKIIKPHNINDISEFMLKDLALFFVPPGVTLINSWSILNGNLWKIILIIFITTVITIIVTAKTVDFFIKKGEN